MKVLLVSYLFPPAGNGGAERGVEDLARGLNREGCHVLVMSAGRKEERVQLPGGVSLWRVHHRSPYFNDPAQPGRKGLVRAVWRLLACWNPLIFARTIAVLRRFRPDIVHVHNYHGFSPAPFAAARRLAIPLVFTPHDYFAICRHYSFFKKRESCRGHCFGCRLWSCWSMYCLGRFHLLSISLFSRELFLRHLRPASAHVLHQPSPLSLREIAQAAEAKRRLAAKKKMIFLFLGRLSELKGVRWLLDALRGGIPPQALFLFAGDGPLRPEVEAFCRQHPAHCRFLGEVRGTTKDKLLKAADVLLCLSAAGDMSPRVILEAFAYGIPVLGTAGGVFAEWIRPGETGWLVPWGDRRGLAEAIGEIGAQRALVAACSENCFRTASANPRDLHARAVLDRYRETLASVRGHGSKAGIDRKGPRS
jgi:glycosyltransferase involved in cell wall biosynthesis